MAALALAHPLLLRPARPVLLPLQQRYLGLEADVFLVDLVQVILQLQRLVVELLLILLYLLRQQAGEVVAGGGGVDHVLFGDFGEMARLLVEGNPVVVDSLGEVVADLLC